MSATVAAVTVHAMLEGLSRLGIPRATLDDALGVALGEPPAPSERVDADALGRLLQAAARARPDPALATALGLAIPYGAFGFTDYLAGSSFTVGGAFESLALHLRLVAGGIRLELDEADGLHWVRLLTPQDEQPPYAGTEMTVSLFVGRFRAGTDGAFRPAFACLRGPGPSAGDSPQARLLGVPVHHGSPVAALAVPAAMWRLPMRRADPYLHATLRRSVADLGLLGAPADPLEQAIRARLRDALPDQGADARRMARLLGLSVRTLQRRLEQGGRNWSAVVEAFRRAEAVRLMATRTPLVEVAARLGYREQTSFTRAFRRWTGQTPTQWRRTAASRPIPGAGPRCAWIRPPSDRPARGGAPTAAR